MDCLTDFEHIEVEIKAVTDEAAAERLILQLHQDLVGFEQTATITSFDVKILAALQQHQSHFKRGLLVEIPMGNTQSSLLNNMSATKLVGKINWQLIKSFSLHSKPNLL
jgi:hypothetical protein